jgi:methylmalonyl-CoA mutase N-terminal domain/subunit
VKIALRTQQVLGFESGVADTADPLGGSYFVESLTDRIEAAAEEYFDKIREMGKGSMLEGMLVGIERGYFQSEIADAAFREQELYEKGRLIKVGVNEFVDPNEGPIDVLVIPPETEERQIATVRKMREGRNAAAAEKALDALKAAAATEENLIPLLVDCARAYCTEGEIVGALREVFGEYTETPRF